MRRSALVVLAALLVAGCGASSAADSPEEIAARQVRVTTTTNIVTDLARVVGGDRAEVSGLMGPGVDPHLYKASAGDVEDLRQADLILFGGLELEGRMSDLLTELGERQPTVAVTDDMPRDRLRLVEGENGKVDPHVWFDVALWKTAADTVAQAYADIDPANAAGYRARADAYGQELERLDAFVREQLGAIPERRRVLITSHDAFEYLGARYGLDVLAIQGISTQTEATTADIERIAGVIAERELGAVFVESSVPRQTIEAVLAAARERGQRAEIGGSLFSDAAGDAGTLEGTYLGMVRHNAETIARGLR